MSLTDVPLPPIPVFSWRGSLSPVHIAVILILVLAAPFAPENAPQLR